MNWKTAAVLVGFAAVLLAGSPAHAQNDQTVVIGFGLGIHFFEAKDDVREGFFLDVDAAGMSEFLVEWYLFDEIGIGARAINFGVKETATTFGGATAEMEIEISNFFFTLNWVPFGASGYTRMGLLAGVGSSEYEVTVTDFSGASSSDSSTGSASLAGIYVDWGGEGFGARFGGHIISTDLDRINGATADGSGSSLYFDLRWAF